MATISRALAATAMAACLPAGAADFSFSDALDHHNSVVGIRFTLAETRHDVVIETRSYHNGLNIDPNLFVWALPEGNLIAFGEDIDGNLGATLFDARVVFPTLAAGSYLVTMTAFPNYPNGGERDHGFVGSTLAQGFRYDEESPVPIARWCQPASDCNAPRAAAWRVALTNVDSAEMLPAVPEPATWGLMALGLLALAARRR